MLDDIVSGRVYLVGAGPGQPDLITVRGLRLLQAADVVLYAGSLVPEVMLTHCRENTELFDTRSQVLETLVPAIVNHAQAGKVVVRLQDGDPCLYGAQHEMTVALLKAGIDFEVVARGECFSGGGGALKGRVDGSQPSTKHYFDSG